MSELAVTLIDVGWGDSILLESTDAAGVTRFALVDCNDYEHNGTDVHANITDGRRE